MLYLKKMSGCLAANYEFQRMYWQVISQMNFLIFDEIEI